MSGAMAGAAGPDTSAAAGTGGVARARASPTATATTTSAASAARATRPRLPAGAAAGSSDLPQREQKAASGAGTAPQAGQWEGVMEAPQYVRQPGNPRTRWSPDQTQTNAGGGACHVQIPPRNNYPSFSWLNEATFLLAVIRAGANLQAYLRSTTGLSPTLPQGRSRWQSSAMSPFSSACRASSWPWSAPAA